MIDAVIEQRRRDLGGFEVGRLLPHPRRRMVGPFVFFDEMGPVDFPPGIARTVDVRPHPHIGLATVTYLFAGEIMHRDSVGSEQAIRPGEVNWMTAGRGITHSERFEHARRHGGLTHGIQSWVALPTECEEIEPAFSHHPAADLPTAQEGGVTLRVIAGEALGLKSPVRAHSPLFYVHAELEPGATLQVPNEYTERAAYVVSGTLEAAGQRHEPSRMLVFSPGSPVLLTAHSRSVVLLLGGEPLGERYIEWNFVSSSRERIEQAKDDWRAGRMKLPDLENAEFIPLPETSGSPPNPMS
ncbi:MAG: pirin family protein [Betaproteobacteria bacterium]|nr:MAG: pirin family protein [Betaproteobacteria bacterium]